MHAEGVTHFVSKPFVARVEGRGEAPIKCRAIVHENHLGCGIGIIYEDGTDEAQVLGSVGQRNHIASWRATEILRRLNVIDPRTLYWAYRAAVRGPKLPIWRRPANPVIRAIGRAAYREIMSMPVSEAAIRTVIACHEAGLEPDLDPIVVEVRAGTIKWRQEFADIGILHPDEIDAKERERKQILADYAWLIISYAHHCRVAPNSLLLRCIEGALVTLVRKGARTNQPEHVVVALAGIVGTLASFERIAMQMPEMFFASGAFATKLRMKKGQAIRTSAEWLASGGLFSPSLLSRLFFWERPLQRLHLGEAMLLLARLLEEHFPTHKTASS
jgi:hypothetical protein